MAKLRYSFTITNAPVSYQDESGVPEAISAAALDQGLELVAFVDPLNGALQLGTHVNGELKLVLVKAIAEKDSIDKGDDLRQEIQKMMFI